MIPGWPYSLVAALEPGRTSWVLPLDAVRLGPADDATEVTAAQVRGVVTRIISAGHWEDGDPDIMASHGHGGTLRYTPALMLKLRRKWPLIRRNAGTAGCWPCRSVVVRDRIELSTFRFSGGRSYRLSYLTRVDTQ
jgi:hypothetical protein